MDDGTIAGKKCNRTTLVGKEWVRDDDSVLEMLSLKCLWNN